MSARRVSWIFALMTACAPPAPPNVVRESASNEAAQSPPADAGNDAVEAAGRAAQPLPPAPNASAGRAEAMTPGEGCPPDMAFLRAGTYRMGELGNTVTVQAFCLDRTEVTVAAYTQCVQSKKCDDKGLRCALQTNYGHAERSDHPINCVDWKQAVTYCEAVGKRLPTEEEWEWAARGQDEAREYPWGTGDPRAIVCWSGPRERSGTCKVGQYPASDAPGGIHDLAGNVWEWTASSYTAKGKPKVNRGGGWISNRAADLGASNRYADEPENRTGYDGFRCAR